MIQKGMAKITDLENEDLLQKTKSLVAEERKMTLEILHHFREIYRRRLYALRGFSSIFQYATLELGYSEASAARRIAAMKLLSEVPEIEEKIETGALSLSTVAKAHRVFQAEEKANQPFSPQKKKEILESLELKSTREAEIELFKHSSLSPEVLKPDLIKPITSIHSEIRFVADQVLLDQLELIKGLLSHQHPNLSMAELITEMAKISIAKLQPKPPKQDGGAAVPTRYIPANMKRSVYHRDQGKCQYVDPKTGKKCESRYQVQYDHIVPFAQGGLTSVDNLQILCATHNRVQAVEAYGVEKMSDYLSGFHKES